MEKDKDKYKNITSEEQFERFKKNLKVESMKKRLSKKESIAEQINFGGKFKDK